MAEEVVRDIRRQTRKKYSAEENIRIVLEGLCFIRLRATCRWGLRSKAS